MAIITNKRLSSPLYKIPFKEAILHHWRSLAQPLDQSQFSLVVVTLRAFDLYWSNSLSVVAYLNTLTWVPEQAVDDE